LGLWLGVDTREALMAGLELPKRPRQHKAEAASYDIIRPLLNGIGVPRHQTEGDYGIDIDLELERKGRVTGRILKIQVKSSEDLKIRKDGTPAIGKIKQSTLTYWADTAFQTSVIAYAVDLATKKIYVTKDLFWQATARIDGGTSTKTVSCMPEGKNNHAFVIVATVMQAWQPTMTEVVSAHTLALRRLKPFLQLLADAFHYDHGSQLHEPTIFSDLLQTCAILLSDKSYTLWTDAADRAGWQSVAYWTRKSEDDGWDGLTYYAAQPILSVLVPALLCRLRELKEKVVAGSFYWAHRNPAHLSLVYETKIPETDDIDNLCDWFHHFDERSWVAVGSGDYFAQQARTRTAKSTKSKKVREV
jgi:hypothetical protein